MPVRLTRFIDNTADDAKLHAPPLTPIFLNVYQFNSKSIHKSASKINSGSGFAFNQK